MSLAGNLCMLSIIKCSACKYQLFLPTEEQLRAEVEKQKQIFLQQHEEQNMEME